MLDSLISGAPPLDLEVQATSGTMKRQHYQDNMSKVKTQ